MATSNPSLSTVPGGAEEFEKGPGMAPAQPEEELFRVDEDDKAEEKLMQGTDRPPVEPYTGENLSLEQAKEREAKILADDEAERQAMEAQSKTVGTISRIVVEEAQQKDPLIQAVENMMAEGLQDEFKLLSPERQAAFKTTGEALVARMIREKWDAVKIHDAVEDWILESLKGVNRHWVQQLARNKAEAQSEYIKNQSGGTGMA
jgi:hypothetical protein